MRRYSMSVEGFDAYSECAPSAAMAKARAYRRYVDGWAPCAFLDFLRRVHVLAMGPCACETEAEQKRCRGRAIEERLR